MSNPFIPLITDPGLKTIFNNAIDSLLEQGALTLQCRLLYANTNPILCNNCLFDHLSNRSLNQYNGIGPEPFANMSICPVCNGNGFDLNGKEETIYLGVIFDSKYWFNWNSKSSDSIRVPDGAIQTICKSELLPKIRATDKIQIDISQEKYGSYFYTRANDPELAGFGDTRYIFTIWNRA